MYQEIQKLSPIAVFTEPVDYHLSATIFIKYYYQFSPFIYAYCGEKASREYINEIKTAYIGIENTKSALYLETIIDEIKILVSHSGIGNVIDSLDYQLSLIDWDFIKEQYHHYIGRPHSNIPSFDLKYGYDEFKSYVISKLLRCHLVEINSQPNFFVEEQGHQIGGVTPATDQLDNFIRNSCYDYIFNINRMYVIRMVRMIITDLEKLSLSNDTKEINLIKGKANLEPIFRKKIPNNHLALMIFLLYIIDGIKIFLRPSSLEKEHFKDLLIRIIQKEESDVAGKTDLSYVLCNFKCLPFKKVKSIEELLYPSKAFNLKSNESKWKDSSNGALDKIMGYLQAHPKSNLLRIEIETIKNKTLQYSAWSTKEN